MLKPDDLKSQIQSALENIVVPAIRECMASTIPQDSDQKTTLCDTYSETFKELVCEDLADALANAIDYYVKNIQITGTIITTGSPVTQTAVIASTSNPVTNGKVPNTLGIM